MIAQLFTTPKEMPEVVLFGKLVKRRKACQFGELCGFSDLLGPGSISEHPAILVCLFQVIYCFGFASLALDRQKSWFALLHVISIPPLQIVSDIMMKRPSLQLSKSWLLSSFFPRDIRISVKVRHDTSFLA